MALSGVRSSWLILARNSDLCAARRFSALLGFAQRLRVAHRGRDVGADAAIALEDAVLVEIRPAASDQKEAAAPWPNRSTRPRNG
jgi:hypothetical protein